MIDERQAGVLRGGAQFAVVIVVLAAVSTRVRNALNSRIDTSTMRTYKSRSVGRPQQQLAR
ncbi:hypothetical protein [Streptomyces sp. NPDC004008]